MDIDALTDKKITIKLLQVLILVFGPWIHTVSNYSLPHKKSPPKRAFKKLKAIVVSNYKDT